MPSLMERDGMTLTNAMAVLRASWRRVAAIILICVALGISAATFTPKRYTAQAQLIAERPV